MYSSLSACKCDQRQPTRMKKKQFDITTNVTKMLKSIQLKKNNDEFRQVYTILDQMLDVCVCGLCASNRYGRQIITNGTKRNDKNVMRTTICCVLCRRNTFSICLNDKNYRGQIKWSASHSSSHRSPQYHYTMQWFLL